MGIELTMTRVSIESQKPQVQDTGYMLSPSLHLAKSLAICKSVELIIHSRMFPVRYEYSTIGHYNTGNTHND